MGRLKQHPGDWQETEIQCRPVSAWSPEWQSGEKNWLGKEGPAVAERLKKWKTSS